MEPGAIKEVDIMPSLGETWTLELGQTANIPRTLQEHLQLAPVTDFSLVIVLATNHV